MASIPTEAFKFGAISVNKKPVSYGKSRVSGSSKMSYILSSKAGCMPGQPEVFITNSLTKPNLGSPINNNSVQNAFKSERCSQLRIPIGPRSPEICPHAFTFEEYYPHDDETLTIAINASYRQVFGNLHLMESELPVDLPRRLRNGDINIKEFIRGLAKSPVYKVNYFEKVNQQRSIELNFKHLLGRPPSNQMEIVRHVELIHNYGFDTHIDSLIDSAEYQEVFGLYIVPYIRCWDSPCGLSTSSFVNIAALSRSTATSDNAINKNYSSSNLNPSGRSQLLDSLAKGLAKDIKLPEHAIYTKTHLDIL